MNILYSNSADTSATVFKHFHISFLCSIVGLTMYRLLFVHASFHSTQISGSSAATYSGRCSVSKRQLCCSYKLKNKLVAIFLLLCPIVCRSFVCTYRVFNNCAHVYACVWKACILVTYLSVHLHRLDPCFFIIIPPPEYSA